MRELLSARDAEAIWQELFLMAADHVQAEESRAEIAQDLLLNLLATSRLRDYVARNLSDSDIRNDLGSYIRKEFQHRGKLEKPE